MAEERKEWFQLWLSWLLGIGAGYFFSAMIFKSFTLEGFLICVLIGRVLHRWVIEKRLHKPVLV